MSLGKLFVQLADIATNGSGLVGETLQTVPLRAGLLGHVAGFGSAIDSAWVRADQRPTGCQLACHVADNNRRLALGRRVLFAHAAQQQ
jgi:hypothetical protein